MLIEKLCGIFDNEPKGEDASKHDEENTSIEFNPPASSIHPDRDFVSEAMKIPDHSGELASINTTPVEKEQVLQELKSSNNNKLQSPLQKRFARAHEKLFQKQKSIVEYSGTYSREFVKIRVSFSSR